MSIVQHPALRAIPTAVGALTLVCVGALLVCDASPYLFPAEAHAFLAALPLALIALAYVVFQAVRRASLLQWAKTAMLALAFLFWAANQICSNRRLATLFNDIAVAAFVFDVFLVIIGWPPLTESASASRERLAAPREAQAGRQ
jgi:hypothetical protein